MLFRSDIFIHKGEVVNNSEKPIKFDLLLNNSYLEYQVNLDPKQKIVGNWMVRLKKEDRLICRTPDINPQGFDYYDITTMDQWLENWDNTTEWLALFDDENAQKTQGILLILNILK